MFDHLVQFMRGSPDEDGDFDEVYLDGRCLGKRCDLLDTDWLEELGIRYEVVITNDRLLDD